LAYLHPVAAMCETIQYGSAHLHLHMSAYGVAVGLLD
jgi:hypothetical protein